MNLLGIQCRGTSKMAAQFYSQGTINLRGSGFFDILIGFLDFGIAKNMRGVLRKWKPRDKYFQYRNLPTHFRLSWKVLMKFDENRLKI